MKKIFNTFVEQDPSEKNNIVILPDATESRKAPAFEKSKNSHLDDPFTPYSQKSKPLKDKGKMVFLGSIFLTFLFGMSMIQNVRSIEHDVFQKEKDALLQSITETQKGIQEQEVYAVRKGFDALQEQFESIQMLLEPRLSLESEGVVTGFQSAHYFLDLGTLLAQIGDELLVLQGKKSQIHKSLFLDSPNYLSVFEELSPHVILIAERTQQIADLLQKLQSNLLSDTVLEEIQEIQNLVGQANTLLSKWISFFPAIETILGKEYPHTIFVLLQNKNELRATGGFMGSILEVTLDQGIITQQDLTDIFHYSGQFSEDIPAPKQFSHLTGGFFPHDGNIYPDFSRSAEQVQWLLEHATADTPDTIIAIHQGILEDVLKITGPLTLPDGNGLELTAENASFLLSYVVEAKIFGAGGPESPKGVLETLLPLIREKISDTDIAAFIPLGEKWIQQKYIQAFSRDQDIQKLWSHLQAEGAFLPEQSKKIDFLGITQENVGGNKSDAFLTQHIDQKSFLNLSGEMFHTIHIQRDHSWGKKENEQFESLHKIFGASYLEREQLRDIMGAGINRMFTTVYLPKGSRLLSTSANIPLEKVVHTEENEATLFQFFFPPVGPGQSEEVELFVASPYELDTENGDVLPFSALLQAGSGTQYFTKKFLTESGIEIEGQEFEKALFVTDLHSVYLIQ